MRVRIERENCMGDENCVGICPEIFEMDGDAARVKTKSVPAECEEACIQAAESCPKEAIILY